MSTTYVCGHKNPDTDSIVSAIAYASLKNSLGDRSVVAVRLGDINAETQVVLDLFGFSAPKLIHTVKTQLSDVQFDTPPIVGSGVTVRTAWDMMIANQVQTLCIADFRGEMAGTLASNDIAELDMMSALNGLFVDTTAFNLASSLEGRLLGQGNEWDIITGKVEIAVHELDAVDEEFYHGAVLISGDRLGIVEKAEQAKVSCLILCEVDAQSEVAQQAERANVHVVLTHYDPYRASRLLAHSVPVSRLMKKDEIPVFCVDDYLDDIKEMMLKNRAPNYPVVDAEGKVQGTVSRFHLLKHSKKRIILVDHNEKAQSVNGLDQAELLEIIDHHRIADLFTDSPVYFRNEPVGSATTIVASMFFEHGVTPSKQLAGLIAGAIVSDTVMFKSPTSTEKDKRMAYRMAQLAGIDIEILGREIFSVASSVGKRDVQSLIEQDFKEFTLGELKVGISQIMCIKIEDLNHIQEELLGKMESVRVDLKLDCMLMMETEIIGEFTKLLFVGEVRQVISEAFSVETEENFALLPDVLSRKKQVVPALSAVLA